MFPFLSFVGMKRFLKGVRFFTGANFFNVFLEWKLVCLLFHCCLCHHLLIFLKFFLGFLDTLLTLFKLQMGVEGHFSGVGSVLFWSLNPYCKFWDSVEFFLNLSIVVYNCQWSLCVYVSCAIGVFLCFNRIFELLGLISFKLIIIS